jgi:hypothetical protein
MPFEFAGCMPYTISMLQYGMGSSYTPASTEHLTPHPRRAGPKVQDSPNFRPLHMCGGAVTFESVVFAYTHVLKGERPCMSRGGRPWRVSGGRHGQLQEHDTAAGAQLGETAWQSKHPLAPVLARGCIQQRAYNAGDKRLMTVTCCEQSTALVGCACHPAAKTLTQRRAYGSDCAVGRRAVARGVQRAVQCSLSY